MPISEGSGKMAVARQVMDQAMTAPKCLEIRFPYGLSVTREEAENKAKALRASCHDARGHARKLAARVARQTLPPGEELPDFTRLDYDKLAFAIRYELPTDTQPIGNVVLVVSRPTLDGLNITVV